ncbi:hypothetical protein M430DRAFT_232097 [Amorphotheca resinae ATCC 22711]|uniref:Uncharacterized protein n=1 Tax=Amorphotheca resinae ATCC 22711 TaxID=857342 RepID=A0A2T3B3T4_AMORE|nr:hypothetical protein M430DRAFT_232097 [Amorphotheca resinae ATCC 22711]PSS20305.1 hypothetical protein M430DRAFT_232097 [Amorphotheca resinae ATCC 22711]
MELGSGSESFEILQCPSTNKHSGALSPVQRALILVLYVYAGTALLPATMLRKVHCLQPGLVQCVHILEPLRSTSHCPHAGTFGFP